MTERIKLSEILDSITEEVLAAQKRADERGKAVMQFEECEVEFTVEVEKKAEGGIRIWVINLGGGASKTTGNIVKVKYKNIPGQAFQAPQLGSGTSTTELPDAPAVVRQQSQPS